ncbi:hypothetical protein BJ912DRAFT_1119431 [Pholiota molesta]|nr:hypothetical protein BJ912DRAFT_1119431 [Pholiota molesta]
MAVFSRLVPTIASAYALQTLFALVFVPQQNEMFYDLGGAIGWMSSTFISLYYPLTHFAPRQVLLSAAVGIWSLRLGSFLAMRAIKAGGDSRFDEIKKQPKKFTYYWMAQATWITLVGLPIFLCNALPAHVHPSLGPRDYIGLGIYAGSFLLEVIADRQKSAWRKARENKQHDEDFISSGLWSISRHPNYVGEVGIWIGIWILSTRSLQTTAYPVGTVALSALSPLFTWFLIRNASVPPLERAGDNKFASNAKWLHYKNSVPIFWPWGSTK